MNATRKAKLLEDFDQSFTIFEVRTQQNFCLTCHKQISHAKLIYQQLIFQILALTPLQEGCLLLTVQFLVSKPQQSNFCCRSTFSLTVTALSQPAFKICLCCLAVTASAPIDMDSWIMNNRDMITKYWCQSRTFHKELSNQKHDNL